jgi:probable HAF family extracellular repeat protein
MKTASRYQPSILFISAIVGVVGAIGSATQVQAASFTALPLGTYSNTGFSDEPPHAYLNLSGDGTTVTGGRFLTPTTPEAFRWTQSGGLQLLGGGASIATDSSYNGSTVVGINSQAFRWMETSGIQNLGYLSGDSLLSNARAVSDDGLTIVGYSSNTGSSINEGQAFRWTPANGMQGLGYLPGFTTSVARDVSGDGSVVVGTSSQEAFRWTEAGGMQGLGFLPGGNYSRAETVSRDGQAIGGVAIVNGLSNAFRWTSSNGMQRIDDLGYFDHSNSRGISGNGSTIVGSGYKLNDLKVEAFIWTQAGGLKPLQSVLTSAGLDLTGWTLKEATSISADGLTIIGRGQNSNGQSEAWIARLDAASTPTAVPESTTITPLLAGLAALGISLGRKRNQLI